MTNSVFINNELYIIEESLFEVDVKDKTTSQIYYNEIRYYPVLSKEEEQALFIKWRVHNDLTAKERLIKCNLRFVFSKASKIYRNVKDTTTLSLDDFIQEGNIGLLRALELFDYKQGMKFITYAVHFIKGHIYRLLQNKDRLIRCPKDVEERYVKIRKAYTFLSKYSKKKISITNLANTSGLTEKEVKSTLESIKSITYFDTPIKNNSSKQEGKEKTLGDTLVDQTTSDLLGILIDDKMQSEKYKFLDKLNYIERNLIIQKYNPHGKIVTDEELALLNNIKVSEVKTNIQRATRKLRQNQKRPLY